MAINVTINGTQYAIPTKSEEGWAANVTALLNALSTGLLQKSGGAFPLTAEVNFGSSFGLATVYVKSVSTNPGAEGVLRLATGDKIVWRNYNNTGNIILEYYRNTDFNYDIVKVAGKELIDQNSQQYITNKIFGDADLDPINASAIFEVRSTTKGALPFPRMTTTQRDAIASPATGLIIYNLTDSAVQFYNGVGWVSPAAISNTPAWNETNLAPSAAVVEARFLRKNGGIEDSITKVVHSPAAGSDTFVDADVDIADNSVEMTAHGFLTGDICLLTTTGVLPSPLAINTSYYIIRVDANNVKFAASYASAKANTPIDITSALGGGTHTVSVLGSERFGTPVLISNGTLSSPSLAFESAPDIGVFKTGTNGIATVSREEFSAFAGGAERFRVEKTGQLKAVYESTVGTDYSTTLHNIYGARAWVNFNGTGTVAIRASGNVSSLVDNGTGDYSMNLTTNLPDSDYAWVVGSTQVGTAFGSAAYSISQTVSTLRLGFTNAEDPTPQLRDQSTVCVAVFK